MATPHFQDNKPQESPQTKTEALAKDVNEKKVYNPFPCSHCDGIFLSWGGLFMHKQKLEAEESVAKYIKNEFITEE